MFILTILAINHVEGLYPEGASVSHVQVDLRVLYLDVRQLLLAALAGVGELHQLLFTELEGMVGA